MSVTSSIADRITLRPAVLPDDESFLEKLYFRLREDLHELIEDEDQRRQLLHIQYLGQKHTYSSQFPDADNDIVLFDDEPVGRLLIDRKPDHLFGVDILLLPENRAHGIGSVLLDRLFSECSHRGVPFRLSVAKGNPAIRLYERLGCTVEGNNETHVFMKWEADKQLI